MGKFPVMTGLPDTHINQLLKEYCIDMEVSPPETLFFEPVGQSGRQSHTKPYLRFRFYNHEVAIIRETLQFNGWTVCSGAASWQLMWSGCHLKEEYFYGLSESQKVNHFPNTQELTRKDRLWANSRLWATDHGKEAANFLPETFVLPAQLDAFLAAFDIGGLWICKPSALSRGRGICLVKTLEDLKAALHDPVKGNSPNTVISRYITNPLLIQGLKFDLRIYVVVTSYDPLRIYVYKEGLTRFASSRFSVSSDECLKNKFKHLTNYSVNKVNGNFVENNDIKADNLGHKWSLSALFKHLRACMSHSQVDSIWKSILDVICKTVFMSHKHVNTKLAKNNCFELFGFDILLDQSFKPWLLEVNLSPSLATESPLDRKVKSTLVADILNLAGLSNQPTMRRSDDRVRRGILHGLAELKRHEEWGSNFLRVYPTSESIFRYRSFLTNSESFRATVAFNSLLFPSFASPKSRVLRRLSVASPVQRNDVHTPPADELIQDVEL